MTTDELIEALEPFARESDLWHGTIKDSHEICTAGCPDDLDNPERFITVGDLRRLKQIHDALLAEQERKAA
ncbi:hypothetical protein NAV11_20205 [Pseudomonas songnenensis]|uniref:Uncharacterized protein n=1 Tax=Pseudomonas songnenensis TaxID=1176259 RepID=A0ABX9UQL1_9PSED|nr:hypothetical protein [Pseudomonas songnenensis]MCQ4302243.1 hypothetical protein [Pseudomonas songnenensis]RMH95409.1 hypothetical protein EA798_16585 [Pseudomonas songnenensis]